MKLQKIINLVFSVTDQQANSSLITTNFKHEKSCKQLSTSNGMVTIMDIGLSSTCNHPSEERVR